jgi:hypothetical protein
MVGVHAVQLANKSFISVREGEHLFCAVLLTGRHKKRETKIKSSTTALWIYARRIIVPSLFPHGCLRNLKVSLAEACVFVPVL